MKADQKMIVAKKAKTAIILLSVMLFMIASVQSSDGGPSDKSLVKKNNGVSQIPEHPYYFSKLLSYSMEFFSVKCFEAAMAS